MIPIWLDVGWWQFKAQPVGSQLVCFKKSQQMSLNYYFFFYKLSHIIHYIHFKTFLNKRYLCKFFPVKVLCFKYKAKIYYFCFKYQNFTQSYITSSSLLKSDCVLDFWWIQHHAYYDFWCVPMPCSLDKYLIFFLPTPECLVGYISFCVP